MPPLLPVVCAALLLCALPPRGAFAATRTWKNLGGTDFNTASNWTSATVPGSADIALFNAAEVSQPNLSASVSISTLSFSGVGTFGYDITSTNSSITLTLLGGTVISLANTSGTNTVDAPLILGGAGGATQTFAQATGGTLVINGALSSINTGALTLSGGGTFDFTAANTSLTDNINVSSATTVLQIGNNQALGSGTLIFATTGASVQAVGGARTIANNVTANNVSGVISGANDLTITGTFYNGGTQSLTINNSGVTTLQGGIILRTDGTTAGRTLTLAGSGNVLISGSITNGSSLSAAITYNGTGIVTVSGNNTYSGNTSIGSGATVKLGNANALGYNGAFSNGNGVATVSSGATLDLNGQTGVLKQITINGAGVSGSGALINNKPSTTASIGSGIATVAVTAGGGPYSAPPNVTISGGGGTGAAGTAALGLTAGSITTNLNGSTYTTAPTVTISGGGGTGAVATVTTAGVITITDPGTGYTSAPTITITGGAFTGGSGMSATANASNFTVTGVLITNAGTGYTSAPTVAFDSGGAVATTSFSTIALGSASTIGGPGNITINALVSGAGTANLTKIGAGTVTFTNQNTYTGTTNINGGMLQFGKAASLYNNTAASWTPTLINVAAGATIAFNVGGTGELTTANIGTILANLDAVITSGSGLENGSIVGLDTTNVASGTVIYGSAVTNANSGNNVVGLTKLGTNTLDLTAANTYTGTTTIAQGALQLGTGGSLASTTQLVLGGSNSTTGATSGTFELGDAAGAVNQTIAGLSVAAGSGTANAVIGGYGSANSILTINTAGSGTFAGVFGGAGSAQNNLALTLAGGGSLDLTGASTYSGSTIVQNGLLQLGTGGSLSSTTALVLGGAGSTSGTFELGDATSAVNQTVTNLTVASGAGAANAVVGGNVASSTLTVNNSVNMVYTGLLGGTGPNQNKLALSKSGVSTLALAGNNTYLGPTNVNAGALYINGNQIAATGTVGVANHATLGGTGTVGGAVTVSSGGMIIGGTGAATGTLTLANGLTIGNGGIASFSILDNTSNSFINITGGGLSVTSNAIIWVPTGLSTVTTYNLIAGTGLTSADLGDFTLQPTGGVGSLPNVYSLQITSGTLQLQISTPTTPVPTILFTSPVSGARVISNTTLTITGSVGNAGIGTLNGALADNSGGLFVSNLGPSNPVSVGAGSSVAFTGTIASTGAALGTGTFSVSVTDGAASPTTAAATGTVDVIANRVINASAISFGVFHVGANSQITTLTSPGTDDQNTRLSVANSGTSDPFGISVTGGNPSGTFNGGAPGGISSDTRNVGGTITALGSIGGTFNLVTSGEGLNGEVDAPVQVVYSGTSFSGQATWALNGNGSWSTNNNWGDTNLLNLGGIGAPGVSGALSNGDTATFNDVTGQATPITISLNGANPSLASITFNSAFGYTIAPGSGGVLTLQNGATMSVTTGTGVISASIAGTGPLTVSVAAGRDLIWSGSNSFSGSVNITSGTLTLVNPKWLGSNAGANIYNINSGAVLEWNVIPSGSAVLVDPVANTGTIQGSGTLLVTGNGNFNVSSGKLAVSLSQGGVLEIANGAGLNNGGNGAGGIVWTNNLGSLQVDAGGFLNTWDNGGLTVDGLTGSGTVTRIGFGGGAGNITVGIGNSSATFAGTLANGLGQLNFTKVGTGLQVLSGNNGYAGSTAITGGTLRITTSSGLGFGGQTFVSNGAQHTASVAGGTLDVNGGITVNHAVTLNGGSLVNGAAGTTSVLDSGIAGLTFTNDPNANAGTVSVTITGGGGTGAAATGGQTTPATYANIYSGGGGNTKTNLYVQMTNAGSGYTPSTAPTVTITDNGSATGTNAAVVSSLTLIGSANAVGGDGNLTINAQIIGNGGFSTVGTGTVSITNANIYTGSTSVSSGGMLVLGNASALGFGGMNILITLGNTSVGAGGTLDLNGKTGVTKQITIAGAGVGGNGALINSNTGVTASIGSGISSVAVTNGGSGYSAPPSVTLSGGPGTGATAVATLGVTAASFSINGGSTIYTQAPNVTITGGGGSGATAVAVLSGGVVTGITIINSGTGYTSTPTITFSAGTIGTPGTNPTGTGNATNFTVTGLQVTAAGSGYTGTPAATLSGSATASAAVSSVVLGDPANNSIGGAGNIAINTEISGANSPLMKVGSGTLILTAVNSYSGTTTISAGTLQLGDGASGDDGTIASSPAIVNNGALVYDRFGAASYGGSISGTGSVSILGSGTQTLAGSNSYSGNTTIQQGNLSVTNSLGSATGSGTVNVAPNQGAIATLSGTGIISGPVFTAAASGLNIAHLAPGVNSTGAAGNFGGAGTLALSGGLTIGNGTNLDFDLGTSPDLIAVTGQLTLGTGVVLNINPAAGFTTTTYTLLTYTGVLTGDPSTWTAAGMPGGDSATFAAGGGVVTVTISSGNDSTLAITPSPISLGSVLVGFTPSNVSGTLTNGGSVGSGIYTTIATGSASASPASGTLAPGASQILSVGASGTIGGPSGNNVVIGTVGASNSSNVSGSATPVSVTANIYETFSGSTASTVNSGSSATLNLTTLANDDGPGGQRAGVTINAWSTANPNFVVTTDNGGVVGTASGGNNSTTTDVGTVAVASDRLSGTYTYAGTITGSAVYTNAALQSQGGGSLANPQWTGVSISGTVTNATAAFGQTKSAFINSGSSLAGYGLTSTSGSNTSAVLLNGTASADSTIGMKFTAHGSLGVGETGSPSPYQSSDTLTLTGLHPVGGNGPDGGSTLTDPFVLQLSVAANPSVLDNKYYLGWYDPNFQGTGGWVNAIAGNSNANLPVDYQLTAAYYLGSYSSYLSTNSFTISTPLINELGAYGYDSTNGVVWAVLNYDSDVEVIPEPATYALIFGGFGVLLGFRRLRKRRSPGK